MQAIFDDDEMMIADVAARLTKGGRARARAVLQGGALPAEPGATLQSDWIGLGIPESQGGSGGTRVGAALLLQAIGSALEPTPFVAEFVARHVLVAAGIDLARARGLSLAVELGTPVELRDGRVDGRLPAVHGAMVGGALLCATRKGGIALARIEACEPVRGVDPLRPCSQVSVSGDCLAHAALLEQAHAVGAALVAAESCGAARGALELAVGHARERVQFGRPIGSYQAIAHRLAQCASDIEAAWSLVLYACWASEAGAADAIDAALAAKSKAGEAALATAEACIQTHGGLGITMAADPHLYLRRALSNDVWFGTAAQHRRELADRLLGGAPGAAPAHGRRVVALAEPGGSLV